MNSLAYEHHFTEKNIPFGIASSEIHREPQAVTRIGNSVIFLHDLMKHGVLPTVGLEPDIFNRPYLNDFAAKTSQTIQATRDRIKQIFLSENINGFPKGSVESLSSVSMHVPVRIGDFIDFSCSLEHVQNAGRIITKSERLPPAYKHYPIGYHGRTSSIVVSGTEIQRPVGYVYSDDRGVEEQPNIIFGQSNAMDYELELAAVIGKPVESGRRITAADADEHIFGFLLLNDWSARDIQKLEMPPLGPFSGKSFGTTISPWIVTREALQPFLVSTSPKLDQAEGHLTDPDNMTYAIKMQVEIQTIQGKSTLIGTSQVQSLYWTVRQMVAHATSSGSPLQSGDILATGTVSEPGRERRGCLLETTDGGQFPVKLDDGSQRTFLHDGDVVRMVAVAGGESSGVGFGECIGQVRASQLFKTAM